MRAAAEMERLRQALVRYATRFDPHPRYRTRRGRKRYFVSYSPTLGDLYSCDRAEEDIIAALADFRRSSNEGEQ
jgi:hypothetical protein